jgi:hypothetical protein
VPTSPATSIYFTDVFGVDPRLLRDYGAFDISLASDLPLFIDPFLLFHSRNADYQKLHHQIISYIRFLGDKAQHRQLDPGRLLQWFMFQEVKQTWLGYSRRGNHGTGLGRDFAAALSRNLSRVFTDFGAEGVTHGNHLERLCLIDEGIGRDNISDFTTNLIKPYLLEYTQTFARSHLKAEQRRVVPVLRSRFDLSTEVWATERFDLPYVNGDFVLLTPYDMLTKDEIWINRSDLLRDFDVIAASVPNSQHRAHLNGYFQKILDSIRERDEEARSRAKSSTQDARIRRHSNEPTKKQRDEAAIATLREYPELVDYFIRYKEDHGDVAEAQADERVRSSERLYIAQVRELAGFLGRETRFYAISGDTLDEARERIAYLKDVIENKGGHRLFYAGGEPIRREADIQIMFRFTWMNTLSDVNREVNNGRGPSDFEVSRGSSDKTIVEFKLASNSKLRQNLQYQVSLYQKASDAPHALKVIIFFTGEEHLRVLALLTEMRMLHDPNIILIDARNDNKPSASRAIHP